MLDNREKQILLSIVKTPQWSVVEHLRDLIIYGWQKEQRVSLTEWETVKNTIEIESKIKGLNEFINQINIEINAKRT